MGLYLDQGAFVASLDSLIGDQHRKRRLKTGTRVIPNIRSLPVLPHQEAQVMPTKENSTCVYIGTHGRFLNATLSLHSALLIKCSYFYSFGLRMSLFDYRYSPDTSTR